MAENCEYAVWPRSLSPKRRRTSCACEQEESRGDGLAMGSFILWVAGLLMRAGVVRLT
jgi:hypothetical protein